MQGSWPASINAVSSTPDLRRGEQLTGRIVELAATYGRYGYRLITGLLRNEGWKVNHKRVERIWRKED